MKSRRPQGTRRHPRFNVDVEAKVHTVHGELLQARTRDLSRSGICLITSAPLGCGQRLSIELVLAFGGNHFSEALSLTSRVVWCTAIAAHYQIGAMFDALTDEHDEFLDMFMHYLDGTMAPSGVTPAATQEPWEEEPPVPPDIKDDPFRR
jgi:hypothetical protein